MLGSWLQCDGQNIPLTPVVGAGGGGGGAGRRRGMSASSS